MGYHIRYDYYLTPAVITPSQCPCHRSRQAPPLNHLSWSATVTAMTDSGDVTWHSAPETATTADPTRVELSLEPSAVWQGTSIAASRFVLVAEAQRNSREGLLAARIHGAQILYEELTKNPTAEADTDVTGLGYQDSLAAPASYPLCSLCVVLPAWLGTVLNPPPQTALTPPPTATATTGDPSACHEVTTRLGARDLWGDMRGSDGLLNTFPPRDSHYHLRHPVLDEAAVLSYMQRAGVEAAWMPQLTGGLSMVGDVEPEQADAQTAIDSQRQADYEKGLEFGEGVCVEYPTTEAVPPPLPVTVDSLSSPAVEVRFHQSGLLIGDSTSDITCRLSAACADLVDVCCGATTRLSRGPVPCLWRAPTANDRCGQHGMGPAAVWAGHDLSRLAKSNSVSVTIRAHTATGIQEYRLSLQRGEWQSTVGRGTGNTAMTMDAMWDATVTGCDVEIVVGYNLLSKDRLRYVATPMVLAPRPCPIPHSRYVIPHSYVVATSRYIILNARYVIANARYISPHSSPLALHMATTRLPCLPVVGHRYAGRPTAQCIVAYSFRAGCGGIGIRSCIRVDPRVLQVARLGVRMCCASGQDAPLDVCRYWGRGPGESYPVRSRHTAQL